MLPKVALLLATYNGAKWIREQLNSIVSQKNVIIDVYVSDDMSNDDTIDIVNSYSNKINSLQILESTHKYGSAHKNFIRLITDVDCSKYDYVCFADQDDVWFNDKIEMGINFLTLNNASAYSSNVLAFWENGRTRIITKSQPQTEFDHWFESAGPGCTFILNNCLYNSLRKFTIDNHQMVIELFAHDWYVYAYARANGYKWVIDDSVAMLYRQHASNAQGANFGLQGIIKRYRQVSTGFYFDSLIAQLSLLDPSNKLCSTLKNKSFFGRFQLLTQFTKFRRKLSDKFYIFVILLLSK